MSIHRPYFKRDSRGSLIEFNYEEALASKKRGLDSTAEVAVAVWDLVQRQNMLASIQDREDHERALLERIRSLSFHEWLSLSVRRILWFVVVVTWSLSMTILGVARLVEHLA